MKFKINRDHFANGLAQVLNVVGSKATMPILSNVLIEAEKDQISLTTTNLDLGIRCKIKADVKETGSVTLPVKRLATHRARTAERRRGLRRLAQSPGETHVGRLEFPHHGHRQGRVSAAAGVRRREGLHARAGRAHRDAEERRLRAVDATRRATSSTASISISRTANSRSSPPTAAASR